MTTLVLEFTKEESYHETNCSTFYLSLNAKTNINDSYIDDVFESIYSTIISNLQKFLGKGSDLIID